MRVSQCHHCCSHLFRPLPCLTLTFVACFCFRLFPPLLPLFIDAECHIFCTQLIFVTQLLGRRAACGLNVMRALAAVYCLSVISRERFSRIILALCAHCTQYNWLLQFFAVLPWLHLGNFVSFPSIFMCAQVCKWFKFHRSNNWYCSMINSAL
jgi:hypothetical protein